MMNGLCYKTTSMNQKSKTSSHYKKQRSKREKLINKRLHGDGKVIDSFIVDKGHKNGLERHDITDNGVILVYNAKSQKLVTKLIAREWQIRRLYKGTGKDPPSWLITLAQWHESMGYNRV